MARRMVESGTPARDISMTSALVSGLGCLPVCAKAANARNRSGRSGMARFMTGIVVQFWVIRNHEVSRNDGNATRTLHGGSPVRTDVRMRQTDQRLDWPHPRGPWLR